MEATTTGPRCRVRVNLKHTVKDGWKVDETTAEVEWENAGGSQSQPFWVPVGANDGHGGGHLSVTVAKALDELLRQAHGQAVVEARRRNEADGKPAAA